MDKPKENKAADARKEPAQTLGISRSIYAAGYSLKDAAIWFAGIFVTLFTTITLGRKAKIPAIEWMVKKLEVGHEWMKAKTGKWLEGPVVALSFGIAYLASHVFMAPGAAHGWKKASAAIDQYNALAAEKDQLVKTNTVLSEENELLNKKLALQEGRPHTDRALARRTAESSAQL